MTAPDPSKMSDDEWFEWANEQADNAAAQEDSTDDTSSG